MRSWLRSLIIFLAGSAVFFALRGLRVPGGDTGVIYADMWRDILWSDRLVYYAREPLAHFLAHRCYLLTGDLTLAFSIIAALCGGLYLALLDAYCPRPAFFALCLVSAATWNFVGHVEFYAPVVVTMMLYFMLLARAVEPGSRVRPTHVCAAFALAFLTHKGTLFYAPSLLWLAFAWRGTPEAGRRFRLWDVARPACWRRRVWPGRQAEWSVALIILMVILDVLPGLMANARLWPILYVPLNEKLVTLLTPLTPGIARALERQSISGMFFVYTFGTWKHWAYFFSFLILSSPLGLALLARRWRGTLATDAARALATASLCGVLWIFMWQPRGFWKDWDLFCLVGLPLSLWASLASAAAGSPDGNTGAAERGAQTPCESAAEPL